VKAEAYEQYRAESSNWLKAARVRLLRAFLADVPDQGRPLRLLEIGAGVGQNVPVLAERGTVDVVEIDPLGIDVLRTMDEVHTLYDQPVPFDLPGTYDVIVAFDVLEHLEDDRAAAQWVADHLAPGGRFIANVPAYQFLFSSHDVALKHFRRYTRKRLLAAMPPELTVERDTYFNCVLFPLAAGMRIAGKAAARMRRGEAGEAARKQSSAVPGAVDRVFSAVLAGEVWAIRRGVTLPFGLSVFCVMRKQP
jgi:SAM-dependent methyltransferase